MKHRLHRCSHVRLDAGGEVAPANPVGIWFERLHQPRSRKAATFACGLVRHGYK